MRCGGLYGAAAAALLVAPVVLARPAVHDPENEATAPKVVTLDVSREDQDPEAVTFHVDVRPSGQDCSPDNIRINGRVLDRDVKGEGEGVLSVPGGRQVLANWEFGCLEPDEGGEGLALQALVVTLRQLDGQEVRRVGFSTLVSQRANSMAVHKFSEESQDDLDDTLSTQAFYIDDKLEAQLDASGPPPRPLTECASLRCLWTYLLDGVKHAASELGDEVAEPNDLVAHAHDDTLPTPEEGEDEDWWHGWDGEVEVWDEDEGQPTVYDVADVGGEWVLTGQHAMTPEEMGAWEQAKAHDYRFYARQPPMLMTIALAVLAVCSLSLWGIHHLHRRTVHLSRRTVRGDTASEDEKGALRRRYDSETEGLATTMAEEIAQLRQVASFVDGIVAAEEGRARQSQPQPEHQPEHQRQPPAYLYACTEQGPPPYDSVSNDASWPPSPPSPPVGGADGSRPVSGDVPGRKE